MGLAWAQGDANDGDPATDWLDALRHRCPHPVHSSIHTSPGTVENRLKSAKRNLDSRRLEEDLHRRSLESVQIM